MKDLKNLTIKEGNGKVHKIELDKPVRPTKEELKNLIWDLLKGNKNEYQIKFL